MADSVTKPWGGRFTAATDAAVEAFTASVGFDARLYSCDIRASQAHARGLAAASVISAEECETLVHGLDRVRAQIESGAVTWDEALEDVHMNIETLLVAEVGDVGKKLHTGRSRNDQIATDLRLYVRDAQAQLDALLHALQMALVTRAEQEANTPMPGMTHLQPAQPVTAGHMLMAWYEMLCRDRAWLAQAYQRTNVMPLGAGALAGSGYAIDRQEVAKELGFSGLCDNSLDAVSDRDFAIECCALIAQLLVHLSRMAEMVILWASPGMGYVTLPDEYCTGSSLMPQKKNPDVLELVRGKSARACGNLQALLMLMKAQPLAYNRDNQEDKEPLFDSLDTALACVPMLEAIVTGMQFDVARMRADAAADYSTATDLADALVARGIAFRDAHHIVGNVVAYALEQGQTLEELDADALQEYSPLIDAEMLRGLSAEASVAARSIHGGTAPEAVRARVKAARVALQAEPLPRG